MLAVLHHGSFSFMKTVGNITKQIDSTTLTKKKLWFIHVSIYILFTKKKQHNKNLTTQWLQGRWMLKINYILITLASVVQKHGAVEGMVIHLLCFDRLLVLHLAANTATELTVDLLTKEHSCCWATWGKIPAVSLTCHCKQKQLSKINQIHIG